MDDKHTNHIQHGVSTVYSPNHGLRTLEIGVLSLKSMLHYCFSFVLSNSNHFYGNSELYLQMVVSFCADVNFHIHNRGVMSYMGQTTVSPPICTQTLVKFLLNFPNNFSLHLLIFLADVLWIHSWNLFGSKTHQLLNPHFSACIGFPQRLNMNGTLLIQLISKGDKTLK